MKRIILIFIVLGLLAMTACTPTVDKGNVQLKSVVKVEIKDFSFMPKDLVIKKGTIVEWTNLDSTNHTVTSVGNFDSGKINPGEKWSFTFNEVKKYEYACFFHPSMKATIEVTE